MLELMGKIPELQHLFRYSKKEQHYIKSIQQIKMSSLFSHILDRLHMTKERFSCYIETACKHLSIQHVPQK